MGCSWLCWMVFTSLEDLLRAWDQPGTPETLWQENGPGPAAEADWHFFKASPSFLAAGDWLLPPEEGSLLSGLISCQ